MTRYARASALRLQLRAIYDKYFNDRDNRLCVSLPFDQRAKIEITFGWIRGIREFVKLCPKTKQDHRFIDVFNNPYR